MNIIVGSDFNDHIEENVELLLGGGGGGSDTLWHVPQ